MDQPLEWDLWVAVGVVEVEVVEEVGVVVVEVGAVEEAGFLEEVGVGLAAEVVETCTGVRLQVEQRRVQIDSCTTLHMGR